MGIFYHNSIYVQWPVRDYLIDQYNFIKTRLTGGDPSLNFSHYSPQIQGFLHIHYLSSAFFHFVLAGKYILSRLLLLSIGEKAKYFVQICTKEKWDYELG